jgi:hypothetical protein
MAVNGDATTDAADLDSVRCHARANVRWIGMEKHRVRPDERYSISHECSLGSDARDLGEDV